MTLLLFSGGELWLSISLKLRFSLILLHHSPATSKSSSIIDWGAEDKTLTCTSNGEPLAWVKVIEKSYYVVNVTGMAIGSKSIALPVGSWQTGKYKSIIDSCTTLMYLPQTIISQITGAILLSGALAKAGLNDLRSNQFLYETYGFNMVFWSSFSIDYSYWLIPVRNLTIASCQIFRFHYKGNLEKLSSWHYRLMDIFKVMVAGTFTFLSQLEMHGK